MRKLLTMCFLFMSTAVTSGENGQKPITDEELLDILNGIKTLPEEFFIQCSIKNPDYAVGESLPLIPNGFLVKVDKNKMKAFLKLPIVDEQIICSDNDDLMVFGKENDSGSCIETMIFNKWNGSLNNPKQDLVGCAIFDEVNPIYR